MALNGEEILEGFSRFIGDWWESTTTGTGTTSTLLDTLLGRRGDDSVVDNYFRITSGTNDNVIRRSLIPFTAATGEVTFQPPFSAAVASGVTYQMHRHDPMEKFAALDAARLAVTPWVFREVRDDTITGDGKRDEFTLPDAVVWGPEVAILERRYSIDSEWNLLTGDNARVKIAGDWTAANGVAEADYTQLHLDDVIPRFETSAVKLTYTDGGSNGTYTLPVANMRSGVTAALVAGRHVEIGLMVYAEVAGVLARIVTDVGTLVSSSAHQGRGWEFLTCEGDVGQTNSATFSAQLIFPTGGAVFTAFLEEAYLVLGNLPNRFPDDGIISLEVEYDATIRRVWFNSVIPQGYHVRLVGKAPITALGDTTPWSGSMEVDERSAMILYAEAAEQLFGTEILSQPAQRDVMARIAVIKSKRRDYQKQWKYRMRPGRLVSPFRQ